MINNKLRIIHVCLASSYTENMTYQDNILPAQNKKDGHEVLVISDCMCYVDGRLKEVEPEDKFLADGVRLIRLPFIGNFLPKFIRNKLRITRDLMAVLQDFKPDVILYHCIIGAGLLSVAKYKKENPSVRLFLDSHEDFNNSGKNFISRVFQYRILTRAYWIFIRSMVDKILYISYETRDFLKDVYKMRDSQMEFYPLGGHLIDKNKKKIIREKKRCELDINSSAIVFFHGGKLNKSKRTIETLSAFIDSASVNSKLLIAGLIEDDIKEEVHRLMKQDSRIVFLGWIKGDELIQVMCASDCYLQPGSQSASLQIAICCGLPVVIYPHPSHAPYLNGNGFYARDREEITESIRKLSNRENIYMMSDASLKIGQELLDYEVLARRLYK